MDQLSRRKMLMMGGGLGALSVLGMAAPAQAQTADPKWVWDAEADPLLASVFERGQVAEVNRLLRTWTRNDQALPSGLPVDLGEFIEQARRLPSWADQSKLELANRFVQTKGTYLVLLYGLGGGILSTAIPNEARAVYYSKGGADLKDRAAKTGKLGYDIHELNAFHPDGHILVTAVKTRLVHAAVRHLLPQSPNWSGEIPISQNDMLVTWHTLPTYVMRKLTEWHVPVTTAEADAYLHVWQVAAHMLGIRDEYIPSSWAAANAQSHQVLDPAMGPTTEGVALADLILDITARGASPGGISRPLFNALARYLVGDQVAGWSAVPREAVWDPLVRNGFPYFVALREQLMPVPLIPQIAWTLDEVIRRYVLFYLSGGEEISIEIPDMNRPS